MTRDGPLWLVILAVGTGAGLGAVCRWMLSYFLNPLSGWMPWGTLASNAAGLDERESRAAARRTAFRHHGLSRRSDDLLDLFG